MTSIFCRITSTRHTTAPILVKDDGLYLSMNLEGKLQQVESANASSRLTSSPSDCSFRDNVRLIENMERFNNSPSVLSTAHSVRRASRLSIVKEKLATEMLALGPVSDSVRREREMGISGAKATGHWRRHLAGIYPQRVIDLLAEEDSLEKEYGFSFAQKRFLEAQQDILVAEESVNLRRYLEALHLNQKMLDARLRRLEELF